MTTQEIADALCEASLEACDNSITPPWIEDEEFSEVSDAWQHVRTLRRQRDELIDLWPHKRDLINDQFYDCVLTIARGLYQKLYAITA